VRVKVELELDVDMKELSFAEITRLIDQLVSADESRVVKNVKVQDFEIIE
jgi:hypothetical protein